MWGDGCGEMEMDVLGVDVLRVDGRREDGCRAGRWIGGKMDKAREV
jgi:hypothetical protein